MTLIVNLFAGPGAGKSTLAALVFGNLKQSGICAELVGEYAKDLTWAGRQDVLSGNQYLIYGKQKSRIETLIGKVPVIVTDSPLALSIPYTSCPLLKQSILNDCKEIRSREGVRHLDFFIVRTKDYEPRGRNQTEEDARRLDGEIQRLLVNPLTATGNAAGVEFITEEVIYTLEDI